MFNKEYPKSCTMIGANFEDIFEISKHSIPSSVGSGYWNSNKNSGVFYILYSNLTYNGNVIQGFRGGFYVK
jgi:hypothetical protein